MPTIFHDHDGPLRQVTDAVAHGAGGTNGPTGVGLLPRRHATRPRQAAPAETSEQMNLAGIDFVSLRLVVLCAELGSLSTAAKQAHMSLSCASHRLSTAEEIFGARLFERDHRGLHPTQAGAVFVAHACAILNLLRSGLRQLRSTSTHHVTHTASVPLSANGNRA